MHTSVARGVWALSIGGLWRSVQRRPHQSGRSKTYDEVPCTNWCAVTARSRVPYFAAVHASSPQSAAVHLPHLRQTAGDRALASTMTHSIAMWCNAATAQFLPCQGWGRGFESLRPLQLSKLFKAAEFRGFCVFRVVEFAATRMPFPGEGYKRVTGSAKRSSVKSQRRRNAEEFDPTVRNWFNNDFPVPEQSL